MGTPDCLEKYLKTKAGPAFLFDLDGTLVDTTAAYVTAWNELIGPKERSSTKSFSSRTSLASLTDKCPSVSISPFLPLKRMNASCDTSRRRKRSRAPWSLRKCQERGPVCVVTNSNETAAKALLKQLGLDDLPLISSDDCKNGKPDAEPYNRAVRRLGVSISNSIVFEDSRPA